MKDRPDAVLLIDIENIIGQRAKPAVMAARLDVLIRRAGAGARPVAACATGRVTPPSMTVLHAHGVTLLSVGATKDAADEALLAEAHQMAAQGCRRFVVASNDSRFAQLADLGALEVIVWATQTTRPGYEKRATRLHRLPCPPAQATGTAPAAPATSPPPHARPAPLPQATPTRPAAIHSAPQPAAAPATLDVRTPLRLAATGLGLLAAGVLFGVGTALGDLATRHTLRRRGAPDTRQT